MLTWFLLAYGGVFAAEALYDNSLYTAATLAARYRSLPVLGGTSAAFMAKMLVAVLIGTAIGELLESEAVRIAIKILGVLTFLVMALVLWLRTPHGEGKQENEVKPGVQIAVISFVAVLSCEFFDEGQAVAGLLAARAAWDPRAVITVIVIWLGATLALVTKGLLTVLLGARIRSWIPETALRYTAIALCLALAAFACLKTDASEKCTGTSDRRSQISVNGGGIY